MSQYYQDYVWKNGLPYGVQLCHDTGPKTGISYKIASDPYHKRVSIEKYSGEEFASIIYDSALFDFRHLKLGEQLAWQKTIVKETESGAICHIRNQDDRLILMEEYKFEGDLCRECRAYAPTGMLLSIQTIRYRCFNDPYDGVILHDSNNRAVMSKHYLFDQETREFTELLKEEWG